MEAVEAVRTAVAAELRRKAAMALVDGLKNRKALASVEHTVAAHHTGAVAVNSNTELSEICRFDLVPGPYWGCSARGSGHLRSGVNDGDGLAATAHDIGRALNVKYESVEHKYALPQSGY